jgi:hypothetical protein
MTAPGSKLVIAVLAFDAGEAVAEDAAIQIAENHLLHIRAEEAVLGGEALVIGLLESLEMILNALVILGIMRFAGTVYWRDVGHLSCSQKGIPDNTVNLAESKWSLRDRPGHEWNSCPPKEFGGGDNLSPTWRKAQAGVQL